MCIPAALSALGPAWGGHFCSWKAFPLLLVQEECAHRLGDWISASLPVSVLMSRPLWQPTGTASCFMRKQDCVGPPKVSWSFRNKGGMGKLYECRKPPCYALEKRRKNKILKNMKGTPWPWLKRAIKVKYYPVMILAWEPLWFPREVEEVTDKKVFRQVLVLVALCAG